MRLKVPDVTEMLFLSTPDLHIRSKSRQKMNTNYSLLKLCDAQIKEDYLIKTNGH